jgi:hypothetical protein
MNQKSQSAKSLALRILAITAISLTLTGCLKKKAETTSTGTDQAGQTTDTTQSTTGTSTTPTVSDLTTLAPTSFDSDLAAHYAQGLAAAKIWHPDAVVSYVSVALGTSLAPKSGKEVYVFGSAGDLDNWYTYSVSQDTGKSVRAIIPKADYLGDKITPINTAYWLMNYVQALQLAEQNGGATFRIANPNPQITVTLSNRTPRGWLWWTVDYRTAGTTSKSLALLINPNLGGVSDEQGNVLVPDRGAAATSTTTTAPPASSTTTP